MSERLWPARLGLEVGQRMSHTVASDALLDPAERQIRPVVRARECVLNQCCRVVLSRGIWIEPRLQVNEVRKHRMLGHRHARSLPEGSPPVPPRGMVGCSDPTAAWSDYRSDSGMSLHLRVADGHNVSVSWFRRGARPQREASAVVRGPHDDPSLTDEQLIVQRTQWFETYAAQKNVFAPSSDGPYSCPCCGHVTLAERGGYEICEECGWEDDGQDDHDSSVVRGGPNGPVSLDDERAAYVAGGGVRGDHVPPGPPA